jgi:two-component system OmpR family response regulator
MSDNKSRLLIVDDDPRLRRSLVQGLSEAGYECLDAGSAEEAQALAASAAGLDLYLVDVMLPGASGWDFVAARRAQGDSAGILFLTARDAVDERVHGLALGADDYLIKPFDFSELLARVAAVLRRRASTGRLRSGELVLDPLERRVESAGRRLELSPREFELLHTLLKGSGHTFTRSELLRRVWDIDFDPGTNTVDVHVARLRRRLGAELAKRLRTVVGEGYRWEDPA